MEGLGKLVRSPLLPSTSTLQLLVDFRSLSPGTRHVFGRTSTTWDQKGLRRLNTMKQCHFPAGAFEALQQS